MSEAAYRWIVWGILIWAGFVYFFLMAGCAADPPAPIQYYREQYGFTP